MTEDDWSLLQLTYRYAEAVDRRRPEALAALFTDDGVIARGGSECTLIVDRTETTALPVAP